MPNPEPDDLEKLEQQIRINQMKDEVEDLAGGQMYTSTSPECSPEIEGQFWNSVLEWEKAPWTTHLERLEKIGLRFPAPEELADEQLTTQLWELIHALVRVRVFLYHTDHLSDRELYTRLLHDSLHEETKALPMTEEYACHFDLIGSGSEEHIEVNMRYYADEAERREWLAEFPDYQMPAHQDPPFDRDRLLPKREVGPPPEDAGSE